MVAILFADPTEASNFREALDSKLEAKRQRRSGASKNQFHNICPHCENDSLAGFL